MSANLNANVKISPGYNIDSDVILGYEPTRSITNISLEIGNDARIRSGTVIYTGTKIGNNLSTGHHVIIREENVIGNNFSIAGNSIVDYGCVIGNNVKIHSNVYVAQFTVLENNVFLAPGVSIANDPHPGCQFSRQCMRGPTIRSGAVIGVNVTILPFITIGEGALIGAGSVVTNDIPPRVVAVGNPARVVKNVYDLKCVLKPPLIDKPFQP